MTQDRRSRLDARAQLFASGELDPALVFSLVAATTGYDLRTPKQKRDMHELDKLLRLMREYGLRAGDRQAQAGEPG